MAFLNALFTAALDNNLVFCQLVGMVSVVLVAQRPQDAFRFGGMLWAAVFAAGLVGWPLCVGYADAWGIPYAASTVCLLVSTAVVPRSVRAWACSWPWCCSRSSTTVSTSAWCPRRCAGCLSRS